MDISTSTSRPSIGAPRRSSPSRHYPMSDLSDNEPTMERSRNALPMELTVNVPQAPMEGRSNHPSTLHPSLSGTAPNTPLFPRAIGSQHHQVPISSTLRTPRVPHFPPGVQPQGLQAPGSSTQNPSGSGEPSKSQFLHMFGDLYDSMQSAQSMLMSFSVKRYLIFPCRSQILA